MFVCKTAALFSFTMQSGLAVFICSGKAQHTTRTGIMMVQLAFRGILGNKFHTVCDFRSGCLFGNRNLCINKLQVLFNFIGTRAEWRFQCHNRIRIFRSSFRQLWATIIRLSPSRNPLQKTSICKQLPYAVTKLNYTVFFEPLHTIILQSCNRQPSVQFPYSASHYSEVSLLCLSLPSPITI